MPTCLTFFGLFQVLRATIGTLHEFFKGALVCLLNQFPPFSVIVVAGYLVEELFVVLRLYVPADSLGLFGLRIPIAHVHVTYAWVTNTPVSLIQLVNGS